MKKIDRITALLIFFIFFLGVLFTYLVKIDSDINEYGRYRDNVVDIKLIDKSFDNFLLKKSTFINYDNINLKIENFKKKINFLDSQYSHRLFNRDYSSLISNIKISFEEKQNLIENFKSNSASLLNSIHYTFDLNKAIQGNTSQTDETIKVVTNQTLLLMKYYINSYIDKKQMIDNINFLKKVLKKDNKNIELELFIMQASRNIKRIESYNTIESIVYKKDSLIDSIKQLHTFLDKDYKEKVFIEKSITVLFFVIALIILFILLMMHKRSLTIKNELLGFKSAVENSDNSIVITDPNKNITYVNEVFEKETGYSKKEALGQNPRVLKSGKMPQSIYDDLNKTIDSGKKWEGEFINIRKDKSLYYEKASIIPIYIDNELKHYLAIKLNITNYIEQKQELELSKKKAELAAESKASFLANMSHEIRTPMNAILGFIEQLQNGETDPIRIEMFKTVQDSGKTLVTIINDILDISKIQSEQMKLSVHSYDIHVLFNDIKALFTHIANEKNITYNITLDKLVPTCAMIDEIRVKQVLMNVVSNAMKFTHNDGEVSIHVILNNKTKMFEIAVKDSGIGIEKDNLNKIFHAFEQEDTSTTRNFGGTGLGLAISKKLLEMMDGNIYVDSTVGEGTSFNIHIPYLVCDNIIKTKVTPEKKLSFNTSDTKVLIVEDNKTNQMLMCMILKKSSLKYNIANNGQEALDMFNNNSYSIILMDENMPIMNGIEAVKHIREIEKNKKLPAIPIVAVTANALDSDKKRFLEAGMNDYISKPYKEKDIIDVLSKYL